MYPAGYGLYACADGTAGPILLELHEGRLRLIVWDDINLEDPSHIIDLEVAGKITGGTAATGPCRFF